MLEDVLNERLQVFKHRKCDRQTMMELYGTIFNSIADIFLQSKVKMSNETMNFVAQCYYEDVEINGRNEIDKMIYTQKAKIESVPNHELVILTKLWKDHVYAKIFVQALKSRN
jgi:GrpB-like predicted nucleotidyltransferase (UPF0157 family)